MLLDGQVTAVTGAGHGMGRAYAQAIVENGGIVAAIDIDMARLESLSDELGTNCVTFACDVAREGDAGVRAVIERLGGMDGLINNAGVFRRERFVTHSIDNFDLIMSVNLRGPFLTSQAAVRYWLENSRVGRIVNVSSRGGIFANSPRMAGYAASKAGLIGMTLNLAEELASTGIAHKRRLPTGANGHGHQPYRGGPFCAGPHRRRAPATDGTSRGSLGFAEGGLDQRPGICPGRRTVTTHARLALGERYR